MERYGATAAEDLYLMLIMRSASSDAPHASMTYVDNAGPYPEVKINYVHSFTLLRN